MALASHSTPRITFFGDSAEQSRELIGLIIAGKKTATCSALRDYEKENEPLPQKDEQFTVFNFDEMPACIIVITDVFTRVFEQVDEDFALAEGEGDFATWKKGHMNYFERNGGWSKDMQLVCERFELLEVIV